VCAIDKTGLLRCAGANGSGQASPPPGAFRSVIAGDGFTCGIRLDEELTCWGDGQSALESPHANTRGPRGRFAEVSIGKYPLGYQSCGRRSDGSVECWPNRETRPRGVDDATLAWRRSLHAPGFEPPWPDPCPTDESCGFNNPAGFKFTQICSGSRHNCGVGVEGRIHCWGDNTFKQLDAPSGSFKQVVCGRDFSCAMRPDGTVECWGQQFTTQ
jgi:alpha-tubulin suppressor-like RCC1 family protein